MFNIFSETCREVKAVLVQRVEAAAVPVVDERHVVILEVDRHHPEATVAVEARPQSTNTGSTSGT